MKKKWVVIIAILLIVGIVLAIIFVNLFKERDTKDLALRVTEVAENGYLNEENESYNTIVDYLDMMQQRLNTLQTQTERNQAENYLQIYQSANILIKYINKDFVFSNYTSIYKANKKRIENNFSTAQEYADKLAEEINSAKDLVADSDFWNISTWANFSQDLNKLFQSTTSACTALCDVYISCVNSKFANNDLTYIIFNQTKTNLNNSFEKNTEQGVGKNFYDFVNSYLTNFTQIQEYIYDLSLQDKVLDIKQNGENSSYYTAFLAGTLY